MSKSSAAGGGSATTTTATKAEQKKSSNDFRAVKDAISGIAGGVAQTVAGHPLDTVKVDMIILLATDFASALSSQQWAVFAIL
jgi:hypothetical protein